MIKPMICPSCGANIQVDDAKEYGFCSYCGTRIQLREVVEIKHSGTVEVDGIAGMGQLLENGNAYLKLKDFGKAERTFKKMIEEYPARTEGYVGLITTYARNFEEENLYALNQIEPLVGQLKVIGDSDDMTQFIEKTNDYCSRLSLKCEQNKLCEEIIEYNNRKKNNASAMLVFAVFIVGSVYMMISSYSKVDLFRILLFTFGIIELGLAALYSQYEKKSKECNDRICKIDNILDGNEQE